MLTFYLVVVALAALALAVAGVRALVNDRVPVAWLGRNVTRPRMWGAGAVLMAGAIGTVRFLPAGVDVPLLLAGLALVALSQLLARPKVQGTAG
ncbi:hypothetical protein SLA_4357 [Streptomyces laurentii]|uniref:Uncharacterized protein n=1 Tax=Streptomyces laurentii TaxID=39478 RepID=A0A160P392_STRLU|nr:hypothetical protein SLA_4357 [Streptomyces laurentii]